jgi:hypothetical protein
LRPFRSGLRESGRVVRNSEAAPIVGVKSPLRTALKPQKCPRLTDLA